MRWLLITAVITLPLVWLIALWLFVRRGFPPITWSMTISDVLNIALFILAVVSTGISLISLFIATASYRHAVESGQQQLEAGEKQSKTLDAQAGVLDAARRALEAQLAIATQQRAEEMARLARRPRIEFDINDATWKALASAMTGKEPLVIEVDNDRNAFDFVFVVRNTGDALLIRPLLLLAAEPSRVRFVPPQFSGPGLLDILPFSQIGKGYRFETRASIPQDVKAFDLVLDISGENMPSHPVRVRVEVSSKSSGR